MRRGIITNPAILTKLPSGGFRQERTLNIEEIRYYSLYFDKVVIPANNMVYFELMHEKELIDLGLIERPKYGVSGLFNTNNLLEFQVTTQIEELNKRRIMSNETIWNIHQMEGQTIQLRDKDLELKTNLSIELQNLLPVPTEKISFEEIFKFKEHRKDELQVLHNTLDELYLQILESPDINLTKTKVIHNLNKNILDIQKVSKEKWNEFKYFSLNTNFSIEKVASDLLTPYAISDFLGFLGKGTGLLSEESADLIKYIGALSGVLKTGININTKEQLSLKNSKSNTKLSYLSYASKDSIIKK